MYVVSRFRTFKPNHEHYVQSLKRQTFSLDPQLGAVEAHPSSTSGEMPTQLQSTVLLLHRISVKRIFVHLFACIVYLQWLLSAGLFKIGCTTPSRFPYHTCTLFYNVTNIRGITSISAGTSVYSGGCVESSARFGNDPTVASNVDSAFPIPIPSARANRTCKILAMLAAALSSIR